MNIGNRIVVVAGLGRCGTSLVMQMLAAADVPCIGTAPDFEDDEVASLLPHDPETWRGRCSGHAVKVLDPHLYPPPIGPDYRIILLSRDLGEQAKSQAKFIGMPQTRKERRAIESALLRERPRAAAAMNAIAAVHPPLKLTFEFLLRRPEIAAGMIHLAVLDGAYDEGTVNRMASRVVPRGPKCLDGFLEPALIAAAAPP